MKKLLFLLLAILSIGANAADTESELSNVQVFTSVVKYGEIDFGRIYAILCIEGVQYISWKDSRSSFTVLVNKYGKPLRCEILKSNQKENKYD